MIKKIFSQSSVRFACSSFLSWLVDNGIFMLLYSFLGTTVIPQIVARIISSQVNFNINRFWVFKHNDDYWKAMFKYYCVSIPQMIISIIALYLVVKYLSVTGTILTTVCKIIIEVFLFVAGYFIQKRWVFM